MPAVLVKVRAKLRHLMYGLPPIDPSAETAVTAPLECALARMEDFDQPWCHKQMQLVCGPHTRFTSLVSRKLWEMVSCIQALEERGMLAPGKTGLVFGVGRERLPSLFASRGCKIVATDQASDETGDWTTTGQHCSALDQLWLREYLSAEDFKECVTFRPVDMNAIPDDLYESADFIWSLCSLEHLGSLENGIRFVEESLRCLRPGGWAFHTTEFNLSNERQTIERENLSVYRRCDIERMAASVEQAGGTMLPRDYSIGAHPGDWRLSESSQSKLQSNLRSTLAGVVMCPIRIVIQRTA
jgi:SAM-dependent methyltransferase